MRLLKLSAKIFQDFFYFVHCKYFFNSLQIFLPQMGIEIYISLTTSVTNNITKEKNKRDTNTKPGHKCFCYECYEFLLFVDFRSSRSKVVTCNNLSRSFVFWVKISWCAIFNLLLWPRNVLNACLFFKQYIWAKCLDLNVEHKWVVN